MRMLGIEPRVQVMTESFLTIPGLVAGTRRIALLQERLVRLLPVDTGVRALPCPFEAGPLVDAMWWHPVHEDNPEHAFFRGLLLRAAEQVTGSPPPQAEPGEDLTARERVAAPLIDLDNAGQTCSTPSK